MLPQVFIVSSKKIQERNYETLFRWLTQSNKINIIGRVVLSVPPMWQASHAPSKFWSPVVSSLLDFSKEAAVMVLAALRLKVCMCMRVVRQPYVTVHCPLMQAVPCAAAGVHVRAHCPHDNDLCAVQALVGVLRGAHHLSAFHLCNLSLERWSPLPALHAPHLMSARLGTLSCNGAIATCPLTLTTPPACCLGAD